VCLRLREKKKLVKGSEGREGWGGGQCSFCFLCNGAKAAKGASDKSGYHVATEPVGLGTLIFFLHLFLFTPLHLCARLFFTCSFPFRLILLFFIFSHPTSIWKTSLSQLWHCRRPPLPPPTPPPRYQSKADSSSRGVTPPPSNKGAMCGPQPLMPGYSRGGEELSWEEWWVEVGRGGEECEKERRRRRGV